MREVTPPFRILIVCAGNTCRSPLAAAVLRRELVGAARRVLVGSAGVMATPGTPASPAAIEVAAAAGLDLGNHRSRRLDPALVRESDLILAMDRAELDAVRDLDPEARARTHLFTDHGRDESLGEGLPDPFGGSREAYEECLRRIEESCRRIAAKVRDTIETRPQDDPASPEERRRG